MVVSLLEKAKGEFPEISFQEFALFPGYPSYALTLTDAKEVQGKRLSSALGQEMPGCLDHPPTIRAFENFPS